MSVKKSFVSGVFFLGVARYSNIVIQLLVTAILARLLSPADFGAVAISTVLIAFFQLISNIGFSPAIIQRRDLTKNDLDGIFTCCFYIGLITAIVIILLSPLIASFYHLRVLNVIFKLLSLCCLFSCLNIVPESILKRDKKFKFISTRTIIINIVCGIIAVIAAEFGVGIYSLLIVPILSTILIFIANYIKVPLRFGAVSKIKKGASKVFNYSMYQFLYNFLYYISRNLDKLVLGKVMGSVPLGYYEKSYHLMMAPVSNLSNVVTPAIQPFFADRQNDNDWMYNNCCKILHFLALFSFPLSVFCFFASKEIILLVFGNQWGPAIEPFQILSISIAFQVIYSPQGAFFQAANSTRKLFTSGIVVAIANLIAIIIGIIIFKSLNILCYGIVLSFAISFFYCYYILVVDLYKKNFWHFLLEFKNPVIISIVVGLALLMEDHFQLFYNSLIGSFCIKLGIVSLIYIISIFCLNETKFLRIK